MGKLIRLKGVNFVGAPKLKQYDEIESSGSLMLFDASIISGLPNQGDSVSNVVAALAQDATGQSSGLNFTVHSKSANNANWLLEKTSKGGLHGIIKQNTGNTVENQLVFNGPLAVRNYILNNPNHNYYISFWSKITKPSISNPAVQSPFHFCVNSSNGFFNSQGGVLNDTGGNRSNYVGIPTVGDNDIAAGTNRFMSAQYSGIVNAGSPLGTSNQIELGLGAFGPWGFFNTEKGASRVLYRAYIEDLTVSGRTAAQVSALDQELFNKAFALGGKFYNDTYTDPNSL